MHSKRMTRCAMLPNHNTLNLNQLYIFLLSFFMEFATNAFASPVNRLIFATNFTEKLNFKPTHHFYFQFAKAPFQQKRFIAIVLDTGQKALKGIDERKKSFRLFDSNLPSSNLNSPIRTSVFF